jgi:dienelactone hydrolase
MSAPCCLKGFEWDGKPAGRVSKLSNNDAYISGSNPNAAVMIIHDLMGWSYPNVRLLADHYAREVGVTVYVPDFFNGEVLPFEHIIKGEWHKINLASFMEKNSREIREPEMLDCARALRRQYKKVAAVGFCYGGWAAFRVGANEHRPPLVDCIVVGHPSLLTKGDIDGVAVPVQILAPEQDPVFTAELKMYCFQMLMKQEIAFDYQHFPGVAHACLVRGDGTNKGELEAMVRGKNAAVGWLRQFLLDA